MLNRLKRVFLKKSSAPIEIEKILQECATKNCKLCKEIKRKVSTIKK